MCVCVCVCVDQCVRMSVVIFYMAMWDAFSCQNFLKEFGTGDVVVVVVVASSDVFKEEKKNNFSRIWFT